MPLVPVDTNEMWRPSSPVASGAEAGIFRGPYIEAENWLNLPNFLRILRRRLGQIVLCTSILSGAGLAIILSLPRTYQAETLIVVDPRREHISSVQEVMQALPPEQATLRSEVDALESNDLIRDIVERGNLIAIPEFNPDLQQGTLSSFLFWLDEDERKAVILQVSGLVERLRNFMRGLTGAPDESEPQKPEAAAIAAAIYRGKLDVSTDGRSLTMKMIVKSGDPELAARLAKLHAELYLKRQLESRAAATERVHDWLVARIAPLKDNLQRAEAAVQEFRDKNQLIMSGQGMTVTVQQLAEVNTQLSIARTAKAESQARLDQVRNLVASKSPIDSVPDVLASPIVQRLREQMTFVARIQADAAARYASGRNPAIISADAQLAELRGAMNNEISKIATSLQRAVEVSSAKERTLEREVDSLTRRAAAANLAEVKLRELERDAESKRALYQTVLNRVQETSLGPISNFADSRIISAAEVPLKPSFPRRTLFFAAAVVIASASSIGLALLFEANQERVRSPTQCNELLGTYGLGLTPQIKQRHAREIVDSVVDDGLARDAVRSVLEILCGVRSAERARVISITSAAPHEGKTILAIWLARVSSMVGLKVLLVDADWRRPAVARYLGARERKLATFGSTASPAEPQELVHEDGVTGMHYVTYSSASHAARGVALLRELESFLKQARSSYDLVIVDSAPVLAAPESLSICPMTDGTIFAVQWGVTPPRQVRYAINLLRPTKANVLGAVVTRANVRKHSRYAFGDTGDVYYRHPDYFRT
jgi:polysaccharide biosynthesis transport protein